MKTSSLSVTGSLILAAAMLLAFNTQSAPLPPPGVTIIDARHYSEVFGETRNFRIFLPPGYEAQTQKRYPVIYFYHGWSQRYFGSSNPYGDFDSGDDNGGDNIANFVSQHDVIVVKPDGYNRRPDESYYVRPYNVSPVETYRQFPLYFPELVHHIDTHYRTLADRGHRGIAGLSMGGFMTFWIGGKYPHLLSAAGNFCGSPEFMAGPRDFPAEYRHLDLYHNYGGMNVRLHYGDKDFIRGYHEDLNRVWPQVMDNYSFKIFDAAHSTCGMGEMFGFMLETFRSPPPRPAQWAHSDVYPSFTVWDYQVMTDRTRPGFTTLEHVDARGFHSSVREFLPDGELMPDVDVTVVTAPVYERNTTYRINDIDMRTGKSTSYDVRSDDRGRLALELSGSEHAIGINRAKDAPNLAIADVRVEGEPWASHGRDIRIKIRLLNKGASSAMNVRATLTSSRAGKVLSPDLTFGDIAVNQAADALQSAVIRVESDTVDMVRYQLAVRDDSRRQWTANIDIPLEKTTKPLNEFVVADGKVFTVAKSGTDTETVLLGAGNGDGIANPGESIVILAKDGDKWWRTDLTFSDPFLNPFGTNVRKSDNWTSLDHVGASAKYDMPLIAADCPAGHTLNFMAEYWLPEYPLHIIRHGTVSVPVSGKDTTPPLVDIVHVRGDNVLQVKLRDGGEIATVIATLVGDGDPKKTVTAPLHDDGKNGDRVANDRMFSAAVPEQVFGMFRVIVEATDASGNRTVIENPEKFVLH